MKSKTSRFIFLALVGMVIGTMLGLGLFFFRGSDTPDSPVISDTSDSLGQVPVSTLEQAPLSAPPQPPVTPRETQTVYETPPTIVKSEPGLDEAMEPALPEEIAMTEPVAPTESVTPAPDPFITTRTSDDADGDGMTTEPPVATEPLPAPRPSDDKYRYIGLVAPRSGPLASLGDSMVRGAEMAIKHFNAGLGDDQRPFRLLVEDEVHQFSSRNRLANDPRVGIIVGYVTERSLGESRGVYLKAGKPVLLPILSGIDIPMLGDSIFYQMMPSDEDQAKYLAAYTERTLKPGSIMVVHEDSGFGLTLSQAFTRVLGGEHNREVKDLAYPQNSDDLTGLAEQITAVSPDVVFLALHAREALGVVHALNKDDLKPTYLGTHALAFDYAVSILSRLGEKVFVTLPFSHETDDKIAQTVLKEYENQYQRTMNWLSALTYDGILLAMQAVTQGGDQVPEIINYLSTTDGQTRTFQGIAGQYSFDEYGRGRGPIYAVEVKPDLLGRVP